MAYPEHPTMLARVPRRHLLLLTVGVEGGMLLVAIILGWAAGIPLGAQVHINAGALLLGAVAGVAMLAAVLATVYAPLRFTASIRRDVDRLRLAFREATLLDFVLISALAGAGEEALFRGFLQPFAASYVGMPAAILVASLAFGALHWISLPYVVLASTLGGAFGLLHVYTGNLVVPVVAHAVYDLIALIYLTRPDRTVRNQPC